MFKSSIKFPATLLARYNKSLLNFPYKTKMITAGTTYCIADYICQSHIEKKSTEDYSVRRSLSRASVGVFFAAPSLHVWESIILPKITRLCTSNITKVLVSVFLKETVLASYFISCLLFSVEALKTMDVQLGVQNVEKKFTGALSSSMKFWTGISLVNYSFVPMHLRPVFVSCWSVVWQSYLSYVSSNKQQLQEQEVEVKPEVKVSAFAMLAKKEEENEDGIEFQLSQRIERESLVKHDFYSTEYTPSSS